MHRVRKNLPLIEFCNGPYAGVCIIIPSPFSVYVSTHILDAILILGQKTIDPEPEGELRKFGLMRRHYLKEHRSGIYQAMLLSGKLKEHLLMMQEQAEAQFDLLVKQMAEQEGVTEHLKEKNQMLWVQRMNNIRERAEEIVRATLLQ